jgi:ATP-dependent DNA helicase RecG
VSASPAQIATHGSVTGARSLSAMCNADGGDLYVGVAEANGVFAWVGFADQEDANAHLAVFEDVSPFGTDLDAEFLSSPDETGLILHIIARKSGAIRYASDGKAYKRLGAQNQPVVSDVALDALKRSKGITSFESETVSIDLEDITNSETVLEFMLTTIPTAEPEPWLRKQRLLRDGPVATVAGALLFTDEPQTLLPKRCGIKIYRYTSNVESREQLAFTPETIEGPLITQIRTAVARVVEIIEAAAFLGEDGLTTVRYPAEALHEVITNSVLHRDYAHLDDVHVRIFENRIEVQSPGRLPGYITPKNILHERLSRNGSIVRLINKFPDPPNKDVGEGLNTAFASMRALNLRDPLIEERGETVVVTIKHELLASPEDQVMQYLSPGRTLTNSEGRDLTGIGSESRMKKVFERLIKADHVQHVEGTAGRGYRYERKR